MCFFVRKDNIGTILGTQKEFSASMRRGIMFQSSPTADGAIWHYLWPAEKIEKSIRDSIDAVTAGAPPLEDPVAEMLAPDSEDGEEYPQQHSRPGPTYIWSQQVQIGTAVGEPLISRFSDIGDWVVEAERKWAAAIVTTV